MFRPACRHFEKPQRRKKDQDQGYPSHRCAELLWERNSEKISWPFRRLLFCRSIESRKASSYTEEGYRWQRRSLASAFLGWNHAPQDKHSALARIGQVGQPSLRSDGGLAPDAHYRLRRRACSSPTHLPTPSIR